MKKNQNKILRRNIQNINNYINNCLNTCFNNCFNNCFAFLFNFSKINCNEREYSKIE